MRNAIVNFLVAAICIAFLVPTLVSLILPSNSTAPDVSSSLRQLEKLSKQLYDVESLNSNYKNELTSLKRELEVFVVVQSDSNEQSATAASAISSYLPHLVKNSDALKPATLEANGKRKSPAHFVIGVVAKKKEKQDHLIDSLRSLASSLSENDAKDTVIVVMLAETDSNFVSEMITSIREKLGPALSSGLIEVISPKGSFYPNMTNLKPTFGDSTDQVKTRAKDVLDHCYLMMYCNGRARFYLQASDDVTTKEGFLGDIRKFILDQHSNEWVILDFSPDISTMTGYLMRMKDVTALNEFLLMFYGEKSLPWLLEDFLTVKYCNPEKPVEDCNAEKNAARRAFHPALFTQSGVSPTQFVSFGKNRLFIPHDNPPAVVSTSLTHYENYKIENAYNGETFFWAMEPKVNDTVTFEFSPAIALSQCVFRSGNADHIDDRFYNTVIEVKFLIDSDQSLTSEMFDGNVRIIPGYDFVAIGEFGNNGMAEANLPPTLLVSVVRLRCVEASKYWALLSEIHFVRAVN